MTIRTDLRVERVAVSELQPYERNSRTHSEEQIEEIAASIREFGFTNPILIDAGGGIIAGHARLAAAQKLGLEKVPVIRLAHLTEAQRRALVIADNRLAEKAGWDEEVLAAELQALLDDGYDIEITGFSEQDLGMLLDSVMDVGGADATEDSNDVDGDDAPQVARPGDLWRLGDHRLVCGDSTDAAVVERLLDGATPHLMVTDPPYGVEYEAAWREQSFGGRRAKGEVRNDDRADWREAWALFPGDVAYVWCASLHIDEVMQSLRACDFDPRAQIIWVKESLRVSRGHYHWQHEPCIYAVREGRTAHWTGKRDQSTVWNIRGGRLDTGHSTQKPLDCMLRPILNNSQRGDAVYDPFCGSGTTLIAAEEAGRRCYAVELNPAYVDIIIRRWQEMTGADAVLDGDGRTFDEVASQRSDEGD